MISLCSLCSLWLFILMETAVSWYLLDVAEVGVCVYAAVADEYLGPSFDAGEVFRVTHPSSGDEVVEEIPDVQVLIGRVGSADERKHVPAYVSPVKVPGGPGEIDCSLVGSQRACSAGAVEPDHDFIGGIVVPTGIRDGMEPAIIGDVHRTALRYRVIPTCVDIPVCGDLHR